MAHSYQQTLDNAAEVLEQLDNFPAWIVQAVRSLCIWLEVSLYGDRLTQVSMRLDVRDPFLERNHGFKQPTIAMVGFEVVELNRSGLQLREQIALCFPNSVLASIWLFARLIASAELVRGGWCSFTCRQFLTVLNTSPEVNVNHVIAPASPSFQNGLELSEVLACSWPTNIDIFDKVVSASPVDSCYDTTCNVWVYRLIF